VTICIVDTSILLELLNVPKKTAQHKAIVDEFEKRQAAREQFLLSMAVLIETGNHIAHVDDGGARRDRAERFVALAKGALAGESPFAPTPFPSGEEVVTWLADFPDRATEGLGLADRSLIALWEAQRALNAGRRVYIWSVDTHLQGYDA
jgi:hypothetical protein